MQRDDNTPEAWLARTMRALAVMDAAELDRLHAEVEHAAPHIAPEVAIASARRAARLQCALAGLLQSTEESVRVLRTMRGRGEASWEH